MDLSGTNLRGARLARADLSNTNLRHADLSGADLTGALLKEVFAMGTKLQNATLVASDLQNSVFRSANLAGANLKRANLQESDLERADLSNCNLRSAQLRAANLTGAQLSNANLSNADLEKACLSLAMGVNARLNRATLRHAVLDGSDFRSASLNECNLEQSSAQRACLQGASMVLARLRSADFRHSKLDKADLRKTRCRDIKLQSASLHAARIAELDLGTTLLGDFPDDQCDLSPSGDGSSFGTLQDLKRKARKSAPPENERYFGAGDVLKNAELRYESGTEVRIDGQFDNCTLKLAAGATLHLSPSAILNNCRIVGGTLRLEGTFLAPNQVGLECPQLLAVSKQGAVSTSLRQVPGGTIFDFARGCRLRLRLLSPIQELPRNAN